MSGRPKGAEHLVGCSKAIAEVFRSIVAVAPTPDSVLIRAESGAGKDVVAREVHAQSSRKKGPFVVVNCANLNESTGEADLFGYKRGAFTGADRDKQGLFQRAHGGTLFLDELGELALSTQAKLLRALQGGKVRPVGGDEDTVNVRVIAATNLDLEDMVSKGTFRIELLSRFVETIIVPPLRERPEDIPDLVEYFVEALRAERNPKARNVTEGALVKLRAHSWATNNVRELETAMKRALNRSRDGGLEELGPELFELQPPLLSPTTVKNDAAIALRRAADAILDEIAAGTRDAAPIKELADAHPDLDLQVQLAHAFEARPHANKAQSAKLLFGYDDPDTPRATIRRAERRRP